MTQLQTFNHTMFGELPVLIVEGVEWFGATEAAKALSFIKPHNAIKTHVEEDDSLVQGVIDSLGRPQQKKFVNESGLYDLVFGASKQGNNPEIKAKAKRFRHWVTQEVLPSIRKHGAYMTQDTLEQALTSPDFLIRLATNLKNEQEARIQAEQKLEKQQPLVAFAETCMASDKSLLVREVAKLVSKEGIMMGEHRLWQKLREWKVVLPNKNEPYQAFVDRGYFEITQGVKETSSGARAWLTMRVTPKGQTYIVNKLKKEAVA